MASIPVKILREGAILPTYGSVEAAGADLYACLDALLPLPPARLLSSPPALPWRYPGAVPD